MTTLDFSSFLEQPQVKQHRAHFRHVLNHRCRPGRHGDLPTWLATLDELPHVTTHIRHLNTDVVQFGSLEEIKSDQQADLDRALRALAPWRKGPYQLFGTFIDTEWRSDWKWRRLAPHITALEGRKVLDVGCGTGYHGWRMLGAGAEWVLGIDPSMRFLVQFLAIQRYAKDDRFHFLPIGIEDMPEDWPIFDTVFSMGILYHRRNPINHLMELASLMRPGSELVLETLIVDEEFAEDGVLSPPGRYAMMRNVWSILTEDKILSLLGDVGFKDGRCVDTNITSLEEQRRTEWMQFHSLAEFLDPNDRSRTAEGYPAPKRGIFIATK